MPARLLRRVAVRPGAANAWTAILGAVVPNNRGLVGRVVIGGDAACTFGLSVGPAAASPNVIVQGVPLAAGEVVEQTIVAVAGDQVWVTTSVANSLFANVMAEEVDN